MDIMCCMQSQVEDDEEDSQLMRLGKTVLTTNSSSMSLVVILSTLLLYNVALVYNYSNSLLVNFTGDTKNVIKDFKTHIFVRKFDTWLPLTIDIDLYCHF